MPARKRAKVTLPNGNSVELYSIGELAFRLGRATDTVRKWEIGGIIPPTCFHDRNGCRMYTLEQINLIVDTATECRILQGRYLSVSGFPKKLAERWKPLIESYFKKGD